MKAMDTILSHFVLQHLLNVMATMGIEQTVKFFLQYLQ